MYSIRRIGDRIHIVDPYGKVSAWSTTSLIKAANKARELDDARALYFQGE